ncbi:MAG TPA: hypothetical protein VLB84_10585 [Bacteroidia bacterium]|nr:hypothetical protein [Bacteroidia bacterium]
MGYIFLIIYARNGVKKLDKYGVYTVMYIENVRGASRGLKVSLKYFYLNDTIGESYLDASGQISIKDEGRRFLGKIRSDDPDEIFDIMLDKPVPDSLKTIPRQGWKNPPF